MSESLTGRVEVTHLSENSFGSQIPARLFPLESVVDFLAALALVPLLIVPMLAIAAAIRLHDAGEDQRGRRSPTTRTIASPGSARS